MTMPSFRTEESAARTGQAWADALGVETSELLREAPRRHPLQLVGNLHTLPREVFRRRGRSLSATRMLAACPTLHASTGC